MIGGSLSIAGGPLSAFGGLNFGTTNDARLLLTTACLHGLLFQLGASGLSPCQLWLLIMLSFLHGRLWRKVVHSRLSGLQRISLPFLTSSLKSCPLTPR